MVLDGFWVRELVGLVGCWFELVGEVGAKSSDLGALRLVRTGFLR